MTKVELFEIQDQLSVTYSYHYGGITPFFQSMLDPAAAFQVSRCDACGLSFCPPRLDCQRCWAETTWADHPGTGTIESVVWAYWVPIDSPARQWTELPYAYAAVRLDGCTNLLRVRVVGLRQGVPLNESVGRTGVLSTVERPTGRVGDLVFTVDS